MRLDVFVADDRRPCSRSKRTFLFAEGKSRHTIAHSADIEIIWRLAQDLRVS
jgi:hypothetical protein